MAFDDWKKKNDFVLGKKRGVQTIRDKHRDPNQIVREQDVTSQVRELMDQIEPMIDQLNTMYQQYIAGVDDLPPKERRTLLDSRIFKLVEAVKATPALRFRFNTIENRYISYRDRWDKQLKDFESGKIGHARNRKKIYR